MTSPILPNSCDCRAGAGEVCWDEGWDRLGREIGEEWSVPLWSAPPDWPPDLLDNRLSASLLTQAGDTGILEGFFFLAGMKDLMIVETWAWFRLQALGELQNSSFCFSSEFQCSVTLTWLISTLHKHLQFSKLHRKNSCGNNSIFFTVEMRLKFYKLQSIMAN